VTECRIRSLPEGDVTIKSLNLIVNGTVPRDMVDVVVWRSLVTTIMNYLNCGFPHLLYENSGKISQLRQRRLISKFLQVYNSLILLPFSAVVLNALKVPLK